MTLQLSTPKNLSKFYLVIAILLSPISASSHHSFATHYSADNIVKIKGKLTEVTLRNPHSFLSLDVINKNGSVEHWEVTSHSVPLLKRLGISKDTLKIGDTLTVSGPRSRRPELKLLFGVEYVTQNGQEFEILEAIRSAPTKKTVDTRKVTGLERFSGKWLTHIKGQVISDSPFSLNEAGKYARAQFDPRNTSAMRCIPPNLPALLYLPYTYEITVVGDKVTFFQEYQKIKRTVTVGSSSGDNSMHDFGTRIARLENDTLIIESTDFPAMDAGLASGWEPNGNGYDIPSSDQKRFTERYTVNEDGSILSMSYTLYDSVYMSAPYTSRIDWDRIPDSTAINDIICDVDIAKRSTLNADKFGEN